MLHCNCDVTEPGVEIYCLPDPLLLIPPPQLPVGQQRPQLPPHMGASPEEVAWAAASRQSMPIPGLAPSTSRVRATLHAGVCTFRQLISESHKLLVVVKIQPVVESQNIL